MAELNGNSGSVAANAPEHINLNVKLSFKQRFDYAVSEFGYNSIYVWISSMMAIFLTDQMGIAAGAVSALTLIVRIFDAINDPIIGSMADRSKDKGKGKYKPWVRRGAFAMSIGIIALFAMQPGWSMTFKLIYMWVVYTYITVCSTCCNMPFGALNGVLTADSAERNKLSGLRMVFANIGSNFTGLVAVPLILLFSGVGDGATQTPRGYLFAVIVCVVIGLPTLFWSSYKVKEVVKQPPQQKKIPLGLQFKAFFGNRLAIAMALSFFMIGFCAYGKMTVLIYYCTYNCNNPALYSVASGLGLAAAIIGSGFIGAWIFKLLNHKGRSLALAYGIAGIFALIGYFLPEGGVVWLITYFISSIMQCAGIGIAYGMVGDAVDFGEFKTGIRVDGFIASFVSLMMKAGGAVGPAILVAWMGAAGYVANEVQNATVLNVLNLGVNVITFACCACIVIFGIMFNLTPKKHQEIIDELVDRREKGLKEVK